MSTDDIAASSNPNPASDDISKVDKLAGARGCTRREVYTMLIPSAAAFGSVATLGVNAYSSSISQADLRRAKMLATGRVEEVANLMANSGHPWTPRQIIDEYERLIERTINPPPKGRGYSGPV